MSIGIKVYNPQDFIRKTARGRIDLEGIKIAMAFGNYRHLFHNKIAVLIPATSERIERANFLKRYMEAEGFEMKVFIAFEHAIEWFSEVAQLTVDRLPPIIHSGN